MTAFLAELYAPRSGVGAVAERARAAAAVLARGGLAVSFRDAFFVAEDETWFWLLEAGSAEDVREAARRAGVELDRVVAVQENAP